jgi:hypothetical protein
MNGEFDGTSHRMCGSGMCVGPSVARFSKRLESQEKPVCLETESESSALQVP